MIPAKFGLEKGVWFHITEGLQGIVVHDEQHRPHVYMLTQEASRYYAVQVGALPDLSRCQATIPHAQPHGRFGGSGPIDPMLFVGGDIEEVADFHFNRAVLELQSGCSL